jgi:hypothetical protein
MVIVNRSARPAARRMAAWYSAFACYAAAVALFSGPGLDHWWGIWATSGYAAAAMLATVLPARSGRLAALAASLAGALVAPLTWLATQAPATPDVAVVTRSGALLLHHGSPYLPAVQLAHGGWLAYNPYLPVMAIFGLPKALGLPGLIGDPRPWLSAATFLLLFAAFRVTQAGGRSRGAALGWAAFAVSSPVLAFPLAMGITDPPVIALICLALALLTRPGNLLARSGTPLTRRGALPTGSRVLPTWRGTLPISLGGTMAAALVLGVACAMKYTAWPALAVLTAMVAARDGARSAAKFGVTALGTAIALAVVLAPAVLKAPGALLQNTVAYPLGLTAARSPAQSPLPGHLLATLGPAGHAAALALLVTAGIAIAASLVVAPPLTPAHAAVRLALGLAALFTLSPATRFGYFIYPLALCGWAALSADHAYSAAPVRMSWERSPSGRPGVQGGPHEVEELLVGDAGRVFEP